MSYSVFLLTVSDEGRTYYVVGRMDRAKHLKLIKDASTSTLYKLICHYEAVFPSASESTDEAAHEAADFYCKFLNARETARQDENQQALAAVLAETRMKI